MNHPIIVNANANAYLTRMIKEAEHHKQLKTFARLKPARDWFGGLRKRFPVLDSQRLDESVNTPV